MMICSYFANNVTKIIAMKIMVITYPYYINESSMDMWFRAKHIANVTPKLGLYMTPTLSCLCGM